MEYSEFPVLIKYTGFPCAKICWRLKDNFLELKWPLIFNTAISKASISCSFRAAVDTAYSFFVSRNVYRSFEINNIAFVWVSAPEIHISHSSVQKKLGGVNCCIPSPYIWLQNAAHVTRPSMDQQSHSPEPWGRDLAATPWGWWLILNTSRFRLSSIPYHPNGLTTLPVMMKSLSPSSRKYFS